MIKKVNYYLNVIQLAGFSILFAYIAYEAIKAKDGMGMLLLFLLGLVFLPFISISFFALLDRPKHEEKLRIGLWISVLFLVIPATYSLIIIEQGGFVIASFLFASIIATAAFYKKIENQLLIINVIATGILLFAGGYTIMVVFDL